MPATRPDVFALKHSGLDAFLYAEVGAETNGTHLTILSILARLGKDPWAEAARWAALPKAAVIDSLARSIAEMPLAPSVLAGARDNAARLVQLLPARPQGASQAIPAQPVAGAHKWVLMMIMYFAFFVGLALNAFLALGASSGAAAPAHQAAVTPEAPHVETGSPQQAGRHPADKNR